MKHLLPFAVVILAVILAGTVRAETIGDRLAVPVDGEAFAARLVGIDADWNVTFDAAGRRRKLAAADLVHWGARRDAPAGPQVLLAGGGVIVARRIELGGDYLVVAPSMTDDRQADLCQPVRLPRSQIRGVVFQPPVDPLDRDLLVERTADADAEEDRLLFRNGDVLSGVLTDLTKAEHRPAAVGLDTGSDKVEIGPDREAGGVEKLVAVGFDPLLIRPPKAPALHALIGFRDGTCLDVTRVVSAGNRVELTLAGGVKLSGNAGASLWEHVVLVRPLGRRVTYLSDLKPAGYKHIPYLDLPWRYGVDRNVLGGRLRVGGRIFTKGLGMHSTSRLAWRLDRPYRRVEAELAIDDAAGRRGSVTFRVFLPDAAGRWRPVYKSPVVRGGDAPTAMSVDLAGARQIALVVDFADRADQGDHADWLSARLVE